MKGTVMMMCVAMMVATNAMGATYSTGFEYADLGAMAAEGWTWSSEPALTTAQVHSGDQALLVPARALLAKPLGEFGTLNVWVYDEGLIPTTNSSGGRWGLSKGDEAIAGHMIHRTYLSSGLAYGANPAFGGMAASLNGGWYSTSWMNAGSDTPAGASRGAAGWMNWEIAYYPDGTIAINLLTDPNGGAARAFGSNTLGVPVAPEATSVSFIDPTSGGADAIYLFGSRDAALPFGDLIVDDLTWTPIPEPASMALLAAGGVGLIRRRRR